MRALPRSIRMLSPIVDFVVTFENEEVSYSFSHSIIYFVSQSVSLSVSLSVRQSVRESVSGPVIESVSHWVSLSVSQSRDSFSRVVTQCNFSYWSLNCKASSPVSHYIIRWRILYRNSNIISFQSNSLWLAGCILSVITHCARSFIFIKRRKTRY